MFIDPSEGEVWQVQFSPQEGAELREQHPAVVISRAGVGKLPLWIVVPITDAPRHHLWLVPLRPTAKNGLTKSCFADGFQCKSVSFDKVHRKTWRSFSRRTIGDSPSGCNLYWIIVDRR